MGLDQYANARKGESTIDEDGYKVWEDNIELGYWRKHPNLQGFMEGLYYEKGGKGEFNCAEVELTLEDISALESTLDNEALQVNDFIKSSELFEVLL